MDTSMDIILEENLENLLISYLLRQKSLSECIEWFSTIDWGSIDVTSKVARRIGLLQVISTEVSEGLRLESEFEQAVAKEVKENPRASCVLYWNPLPGGIVVSSSSNVIVQNNIVMPAEDRELRSWSISPQGVSA